MVGQNVKENVEVTFDEVLTLAQQLAPADQARLIARLAPKMVSYVEGVAGVPQPRRHPLRGRLSYLGTAPSAEEIDEVQREMTASFDHGEL